MPQILKTRFFVYPELYLIILLLLVGYSPPFDFNPLFLILAGIMLVQLIIRNRLFGLLIASLFLILNLLLLGAILSELFEFSTASSAAIQLLLGGLLVWTFSMLYSGKMFYNYLREGRVEQV